MEARMTFQKNAVKKLRDRICRALSIRGFISGKHLRWTPHPVIVTIGDNRDYIRVLLYSCYTTITGGGSS